MIEKLDMPVPEAAEVDLNPERFEDAALRHLKTLVHEGLDSGSPQPARTADEVKRNGREWLRTLRGAWALSSPATALRLDRPDISRAAARRLADFAREV